MADISLGWQVESWSADPYSPDLGSPWAKVQNSDAWPGYTFTVRLGPDLSVTGLDIDAGDGDRLTAELLRKVPMGEIASVARAHMSAYWSEYEATRNEVARQSRPLPAVFAPTVDMRRRGRRGRDDSELAELAAAYVRCLIADRHKPMVLLSDETGLDPSQLRGLLTQARRRGLLTAAAPGVPGGALTAKGRRLTASRPVSAWEQATPEQRQGALDREARFAALNAAAEVGQVTTDEYRDRIAHLSRATF